MAMTVTVTERTNDYLLSVHIDTTKVLEDNSPDPAYVREYVWGKDMSLERIKAEAKLLAEDELAKMTAGTVIEQNAPVSGGE